MKNKCRYCGEVAEDCSCQKLRLLLRVAITDCEGKFAEYTYKTQIVFVPFDDNMISMSRNNGSLEVIGGEWLVKEQSHD